MDSRDERLERRLQELGGAFDRAVGDVDPDAGWREIRAQAPPARRQRRARRRTGWWVGAAAVLAAVLVAAPYALQMKPPAGKTHSTPPTAKATGNGVSLPIGNVLAVQFLSANEGWAAAALGGYGAQNAVLSTSDGGKSWQVHRLPKGYRVLALHMLPGTGGESGDLIAEKFTGSGTAPPDVAIFSTQSGFKHVQESYSAQGSQALLNGTMPMRVGLQSFGSEVYAFTGGEILKASGSARFAAGASAWRALSLPKGFEPVHMDFLSASRGFVAGQECPTPPQPGTSEPNCKALLIETEDGGTTWSTAFTAPQQSPWSYSDAVSFASAQDGWFFLKDSATWQGYLYQTTDGGKTWTLEQSQLASGRDVAGPPTFISPEVGWLPTNAGAAPYTSGLLVTRDGGRKWTTVGAQIAGGMATWSLNGVSLVSDQVGYAAGISSRQQGFLVKTTDGGRTWTQVLPALAPASFIDYVSPERGFGIGLPSDPSAVLATTDGGKTWRESATLPGTAMGLSFVDATTGYAVAMPPRNGEAMQVLRTTDGGRHWSVRATLQAVSGTLFPTAPYVKFFDAQHGVLEEESFPQAVLARTSDGGRTWTRVSTQQAAPGSWREYSFLTPETGYMLVTGIANGAQATAVLERTQDGGATWTTLSTFPDEWGQAIHFGSVQSGWLAMQTSPASQGAKTVILRTADGGKTFSTYDVPGTAVQPIGNDLRLMFQGEKQGWLMGLGSLYRTEDGGQTWTLEP